MQNEAMNNWFVRGKRDIEDAERLFNAGGHTATVAVLIQQAVEKYIKGFLCARGWKLKKTHDIEELITCACEHDKSFAGYLDFARLVTAYYVEDRYPPSSPDEYSKEEISGVLKTAKELIEKIKI